MLQSHTAVVNATAGARTGAQVRVQPPLAILPRCRNRRARQVNPYKSALVADDLEARCIRECPRRLHCPGWTPTALGIWYMGWIIPAKCQLLPDANPSCPGRQSRRALMNGGAGGARASVDSRRVTLRLKPRWLKARECGSRALALERRV